MKVLFYSLMVSCLLAGCQKEFDTQVQPDPRTEGQATLTLDFSCTELEPVSPLALNPSQEQQIKDINLYLFHKTTGTCKRQYITGSTSLSLQLPRGEWDVYAIANHGSNLGDRGKTAIENFQMNISSESALE